jgi:prepilin-type N-terminal cleavage/methylation domain-containing protein
MVMKRTGFSLVELMVVMFIAAVLLGLVLPAVRSAQVAGVDKQTMNNLKQMSLSTHSVNDVFKKLPPAFGKFGQIQNGTVSVHVHLMPYIEEDNLYKTFLKEVNKSKKDGKGDTKAKVKPFISPIDPSAVKKDKEGVQNSAANLRVFADRGFNTKYNENMPALKAVEPGTASIPRTFLDGTSNTIAFVTKYGYCGEDGGSRYAAAPNTKYAAFFGQNAATKKADPADPKATFQLYPDAKQCLSSPLMGQSFTKKGLMISMFDGSARTVSPNVSAETWNSAVQPNDGNVLGKDWD